MAALQISSPAAAKTKVSLWRAEHVYCKDVLWYSLNSHFFQTLLPFFPPLYITQSHFFPFLPLYVHKCRGAGGGCCLITHERHQLFAQSAIRVEVSSHPNGISSFSTSNYVVWCQTYHALYCYLFSVFIHFHFLFTVLLHRFQWGS